MSAAGLLVALTTSLAAPQGFWGHWGDGKAELDGYALTQQRYGETRKGQAVLVFVTEDFSETFRVKADPGKHPKEDVYPVVKLNLVEDFQTGIYDYNLMTGVWARVDGGAPVKMSFSSQEWCGQVFETWWFRPDGSARYDRHSYFDGEADDADVVKGGVTYGDTLFLAVRNLASGAPAAGKSTRIWYTPRLKSLRLLHKPADAVEATFSRSATTESVTVPAGTFEVERFSVTSNGTVRITFLVEKAEPHRVIVWDVPGEEHAEMLGSMRDAYWTHNHGGDEKLLEKLGIRPQPSP